MLELLLVVLAITTPASSIAVKAIGMPAQARLLRAHPDAARATSLVYHGLSAGSYLSLLCYCALKHEWVVGGPAALGVAGALWICVLIVRGRVIASRSRSTYAIPTADDGSGVIFFIGPDGPLLTIPEEIGLIGLAVKSPSGKPVPGWYLSRDDAWLDLDPRGL